MSTDNALAKVPTTTLAETSVETATAQATAMARGQVEAQYLMAERHPRNMDLVRQRLLKECDRTGFAEVAIYSIPRAGIKIEGPTIRFAEGVRRLYGNMLTQSALIYEDDHQQIIRITVVDFETNSPAISDVSVSKCKEVRNPRKGEEVISARANSTGQTVYKVAVTDDDMRMKRGSEAARARRNLILELIPADLKDECMARCRKTMKVKAKQDPDAYRKQVVDGFTLLGVPADELAKYLSHDLGSASPDEMLELRIVYQTVKDGEATWHECLAAKTGIVADAEADPNAELKAKIQAKVAGKKAARTSQPKAKAKAKSKAKAPPADGLTDEQRAQGWEIDPQTKEPVPPVGGAS